MIDPKHELAVTRQAELVGISRAAVYYVPRPIPQGDLALQRRVDALHLEHPFAGSRLLKKLLRAEGYEVGRKHVATLMRRMGIEALYRKKSTSKRHPEHEIYPYLLRNVAIERANQVWALDITYIRCAGVRVLLRGDGLGKPPDSRRAALEHAYGGLLRGGVGRGHRAPRNARDRQHRPGQSVHRLGVHRRAQAPQHRH
jgi:hypothetical protein